MSNLVQAAEELEYVPKEELVRMMEQGDMKYPPYLVLSEIQRRTQLENMVMQPKPNTTVAQEVVSEFAQPQGLAGMPQGMSADISLPPSSQTVYEDRGIPASGMAAGGYLGGGKMTYTGPTIYDDEGNELEGLEGLQALKESKGLSRLLRVFGMNEGGITGYADKGITAMSNAEERARQEVQEALLKQGRYRQNEREYQEGKRIFPPLTPKDYIVSDAEYRRLKDSDAVMGEDKFRRGEYRPLLMLARLIEGEGQGRRFMPQSEYDASVARMKQSMNEKRQRQMGMNKGGLLGFNTGANTDLAFMYRDVFAPATGYLTLAEQQGFTKIAGNPNLARTFTNLYNTEYSPRPGNRNTAQNSQTVKRNLLRTLVNNPEGLETKIKEYNESGLASIDFDALGIPTPQKPVSGDGTDSNIFKAPTIKENQTPETTETNQNITDIVKGQMGKFGLSSTALTPPSEEQRNREKQALILSTLAKNIGSATNLSGIGEGLADATALAIGKSAADRKEDAEFLKSKRADVVSEIQIISSLQDIGARIRSNDIKERQIAQENAKLLLELLQDPTISVDPEKTKLYLAQLESYLQSGNTTVSPSTGVGGVSFTK